MAIDHANMQTADLLSYGGEATAPRILIVDDDQDFANACERNWKLTATRPIRLIAPATPAK